MFKSFFLNRTWLFWSLFGSLLIVVGTWYKVELDVEINHWFGSFYNSIQEALTKPGSVKLDDFLWSTVSFLKIAFVYMLIGIFLEFFISHYIFRWRTAMNEYYTQNWTSIRHVEGASQRIQEDTMRFARIMESLGLVFLRSVLTLIAFLPLLNELSKHVTELPWIGHIDHSLIFVAILSAIFGTTLLAIAGMKLPGLEFNNQKVEAAYRKELVLGEDSPERADPSSLGDLYSNVRKNYFRLFKYYMVFNIAKYSYLQTTNIMPYVILAPTIIAGVITLGILNQILRAFGRVEESFQFLVNSWSTIVELISIYKRLKAFEKEIDKAAGQSELVEEV